MSTERYTLEFRDEAIQQGRVKPDLRAPTPKVCLCFHAVTPASYHIS